MAEWHYGVILDAGSSGTRVHVYKWPSPSSARSNTKTYPPSHLPILTTEKDWTKKLTPGISSFADRPSRVGQDHLKGLVQHAQKYIPAAQISETPIFLLATAGMRLLPSSDQTAIMDATCSYLQSTTKFQLPDCKASIQVIPGDAEGLYGWIAANYLLGGFDPPSASPSTNQPVGEKDADHRTCGFLEMGGASAQIAFAPNAAESRKHANDLKLVRLRTNAGASLEYKVFVTTWLGYGVQEARRRYTTLRLGEGKGKSGKDVPDPCLPAGLRVNAKGDIVSSSTASTSTTTKHEDAEAVFVGKGSFKECLKQTYPLLDKDAPCEDEPCLVHGIHTPAIDFDVNHFVGTSEFWYSTHGVFGPSIGDDDGKSSGKEEKAYDFHTYQKKVDKFCNQDWKTIRKAVSRKKYGAHVTENDVVGVCFKASWIINMLHDGIGVPRVGLDPVLTDDPAINGTKAVQDAARKKGFLDPFRAVDKIDNVEVSWTLGRMLLYASSEISPATNANEPTAVGYGSNVASKDLPADFEFGGLRTSASTPPQAASVAKDWHHQSIFGSASSSRRIPGLVLFLLIFALAAYLLCGRERRLAVYHRIASLVFRHRRERFGSPPKPGRKRWFGIGGDSLFKYEPVSSSATAEGQLEMGELGPVLSDSDDDAISVSSPSRKRPGAASESSISGLGGGGGGSGSGSSGQVGSAAVNILSRAESRDRLGPGASLRPHVSGSRSRTGSPSRRGSPMVLPSSKSSLD